MATAAQAPDAVSPPVAPAVPRSELLATAAELLRQPEVQAAPLERRVQFLRAKGLNVGEICRAFQQADQVVDLLAIEEALASLPSESSPSSVRTAFGMLLDVVKLVGYASMAAGAIQKWCPFTISIDPAFYDPDQQPPNGTEEPTNDKLVGNWYDLHAADLQKAEEEPAASATEDLEKELQQLRSDNSGLRLELATLKGQLRALQRKQSSAAVVFPPSITSTMKSAEDLLKPLPPSPPTTRWEEPLSPEGAGDAGVADSLAEPTPVTSLESTDAVSRLPVEVPSTE
eukprot:GGOE01061466.1.p1 GENE.GGOE01061466.1~~GGOE01061466.1.p1  ORF type:complete len:300 (-),score=91.98 GGOE01061466.1:260-1117(-)